MTLKLQGRFKSFIDDPYGNWFSAPNIYAATKLIKLYETKCNTGMLLCEDLQKNA